jgi:hypothetical protein
VPTASTAQDEKEDADVDEDGDLPPARKRSMGERWRSFPRSTARPARLPPR